MDQFVLEMAFFTPLVTLIMIRASGLRPWRAKKFWNEIFQKESLLQRKILRSSISLT